MNAKPRLAIRLIILLAASVAIGGGYAWYIFAQGGPEALGGIIPLIAVGAIHLCCLPFAVFNAYKHRSTHRFLYWLICLYFVAFCVAAFVVSSPEIMGYVLLLTVLCFVPVLVSKIRHTWRSRSRQSH